MWFLLILLLLMLGCYSLLYNLEAFTVPKETQSELSYETFHSPLQEGAFLRQSLLENDAQKKLKIKEGDFFSGISSERKVDNSNYDNNEGSFLSALLAENRDAPKNA